MSMKKHIAGMALMGMALSATTSDPIQEVEQKERRLKIGGFRHKIATRSQKDRANTIKRMKINARRKKYGMPALRSQRRFGGYRIPSI